MIRYLGWTLLGIGRGRRGKIKVWTVWSFIVAAAIAFRRAIESGRVDELSGRLRSIVQLLLAEGRSKVKRLRVDGLGGVVAVDWKAVSS